MSSVERLQDSLDSHSATLHSLARASIGAGFSRGTPATVDPGDYPPVLQTKMASFVTLLRVGELRGCVGTANAVRSLVQDVSMNAYGAAFCDSRFLPLGVTEFETISIELSVLTEPKPVVFADEQDLEARLVPGRSGLILEHRGGRGLFLPQVWEGLPDPGAFLFHLKAKAGLSQGPLDPAVRALSFEAVKIVDPAAPAEIAAV